MIVKLLEKGWFDDKKNSPLHCVYLANFADAVRLLSIEQAGK